MIQVADNFNYRGKKPNFDRDSFDTLQDMKNYSENSLDDGHISYCKETDKHYKFNSNNQSDPTTGKWVEQHEAVPADEEDITEQNGTLYNNKFKSFDTFFSTIGNRVYLTGQITIQIPEDNSYGKFNSFNIGEEFIIPITIHYNKTSTATSDILYNFNNLLLTKADWYSEEDDIEIKGNLIGSKSQSIVIGKSKTGWNSKKLNVTIFDNTNCYISFVPKTTDTHAEIKLFIYARPFLNKSNTSTGNATVKTINIRSYGDTQHRPIIDRCNIGTMYFDTTLGKPIFNKNNSQWIDATGATV